MKLFSKWPPKQTRKKLHENAKRKNYITELVVIENDIENILQTLHIDIVIKNVQLLIWQPTCLPYTSKYNYITI